METQRLDLRRRAVVLTSLGLGVHAFFVPISIAVTQIGLAAAAAGLLLAAAGGWRPRRTPLDVPLCALVAAALLSDALSRYGPPSLPTLTLWRSAIGFWIVAQALPLFPEPRNAALRLLGFAAAGLALASLVGLAQYWTGADVVYRLGLRDEPRWVEAPGVVGRFGAMGFFISRLTFGHNASTLVSLLAGALAGGAIPRRWRWPTATALCLAFAAVLATLDRAAWLGLAAAGVCILWLRWQQPGIRRLAFALALAALVAALLPPVRSRFTSAFDLRKNADRVFLWARAAEVIRDHPLFGVGFGNYPRIGSAYYDRVDPSFLMRTWAHNTELSLLAETGPAGLLALLWLGVRTASALLRRAREGDGLAVGALAAGAALVVVAQGHDVLYDTKVMYALWLGLGLSLPAAPAAQTHETEQQPSPPV